MNNNYVKIFVLVTLYFLSLLLLIPSASLRGNAAPFSGEKVFLVSLERLLVMVRMN